jgi:hypothetical protein
MSDVAPETRLIRTIRREGRGWAEAELELGAPRTEANRGSPEKAGSPALRPAPRGERNTGLETRATRRGGSAADRRSAAARSAAERTAPRRAEGARCVGAALSPHAVAQASLPAVSGSAAPQIAGTEAGATGTAAKR